MARFANKPFWRRCRTLGTCSDEHCQAVLDATRNSPFERIYYPIACLPGLIVMFILMPFGFVFGIAGGLLSVCLFVAWAWGMTRIWQSCKIRTLVRHRDTPIRWVCAHCGYPADGLPLRDGNLQCPECGGLRHTPRLAP
jgi:rubredoxin